MEFPYYLQRKNDSTLTNARSFLQEVQTEPLNLSVSNAMPSLRRPEIMETPYVVSQDPYFQMLLKYGLNIKPKDAKGISNRLKARSLRSFEKWKNWAMNRNIDVS